MRWWKVLGLAGFVGVAATGVVIARSERSRRAYTPEQIRARLHARLEEAAGSAPAANVATGYFAPAADPRPARTSRPGGNGGPAGNAGPTGNGRPRRSGPGP